MSLSQENLALVKKHAPWALNNIGAQDDADLEAALNAARAQAREASDAVIEAQNAQIRSLTTLATELSEQVRTGAAARAQAPEGWRLVPVEPDSRMLAAGNHASLSISVLMDDTRYACEAATYRAMIAASPAPPLVASVSVGEE